MGNMIFLLLLTIGIFFVFWKINRSRSRTAGIDKAKMAFQVWGLLGPFMSGKESASAMRKAYMAVLGAACLDINESLFAQHEISFNNSPEQWEETRLAGIEIATSEAITIAEKVKANDGINEFFGDTGHEFELVRQPDGNLIQQDRRIWSDEEIEKKTKQSGQALSAGIGSGLLNDPSKESQVLIQFLQDIYREDTGKDPYAEAVEKTWLALFFASEENPDSELIKRFRILNDAHSASLPNDE